MIDFSCLNYDGDEDCHKCCVNGYIFFCPSGCKDYRGFYSHDKPMVNAIELAFQRLTEERK